MDTGAGYLTTQVYTKMTDSYVTVADSYDIMIDWPARLARERPFFERLFQEAEIWRVLDIGAATGHHSRMFAEFGAKVIGIDPSAAMLARARALTPGVNPHFLEGGFADIHKLARQFDLITILGNTLSHVGDVAGLSQAVQAMYDALSAHGHLCIQVINYDSLKEVGSRWLPLVNRHSDDREYLFLREHRIVGDSAEFTIVTLTKRDEWQQTAERNRHVPLTSEVLSSVLKDAGFSQVALYGDYEQAPFDPATSASLIVLAGK